MAWPWGGARTGDVSVQRGKTRRERRAQLRAQVSTMVLEQFEPRVLLSDTPFGTVLASDQNPGTIKDADGTSLQIVLTGAGHWQLTQGDPGHNPILTVTGTAATSTLTLLTSTDGDGRFGLGAIDVQGSIKAITGAKVDLGGNLSVSGALGSSVLGNVSNAAITVGGTGAIAKLVFGTVKDATISTPASIGTLSVQDWEATAGIANGVSGASIGLLQSAGDFDASLNLSGVGAAGRVLTSASIDGALGAGTWYVKGGVGQISARSVAQGWRGNIVGAASQFVTSGDFDGQLAAAVLNSLAVGGSLNNASIAIGADLGQDAKIGGTGANADTFGQGVLASVRVTGSVTGSTIRVGVDPKNGSYEDGDDVFSATGSQIQQIFVGGAMDAASLIEATSLPTTVRVNGKTIDPTTDSHFKTKPLHLEGVQITGALAVDSGVSATDGLTNNPAIAGTAIDSPGGQGIATLRAGLDATATAGYIDILTMVGSDGHFQISKSAMSALAGGTLADGAHVLHFVATNHAGISSTFDLSFTLDTIAPTAPGFDLDTASDDGTVGDHATSLATVTLAGTTSANATVTLGSLGTTADAQGKFSFANIALTEGANAFTATATDAAGNSATFGLTITRVVNGVVITSALAHDTGSSATDKVTSDPTISGTIAPKGSTTVTGFKAGFDGAATNTYTNVLSTLSSGAFTLDRAKLNAVAGGTLADGAHILHLIVTDSGGGTTTQDIAFTLDSAGPAAPAFDLSAIDKVGTSGHQTKSAAVTITGTADAGATLTLGGATTVANNQGVFQFNGVALAVGDNVLTVTATDSAGNSKASALTVTRLDATVTADMSVQWVRIALKAVANDGSLPEFASRALAMEGIAAYDVINAINGVPGYLVSMTAPTGASADAAIAAAAYDILTYLYPGQQASLDALYAQSLNGIPDGQAKIDGMVLGKAIADKVIAIRSTDGFDKFVTYPGSTDTGKWRPTGPVYDIATNPQWATLTPFSLTSPDQFRPGGPPAMDSQAYADAINKTKSLGAANSTTRTADQTQIARFWADGVGTYTPPGAWAEIATEVAVAKGDSLAQNVKLFAELGVAVADAAIAAWDAKFTYGAWRPDTAINNASKIGNAAITEDTSWQPLLIDPAHPEYVSGHSTFSAAAAEVLIAAFGDNVSFSTQSTSLPNVTRSFTSFTQAVQEAGESRIYGGIHFEFSNQDGQALGKKVGDWALQSFNLAEDKQPPKLVIDQTSGLTTNKSLTVTGTISDQLSGVAGLTVSIDGGTAMAVTFDAKTGAFSVPTGLKVDGTADGAHTLVFKAVDAAGNAINPVTFGLTLLTKAPTITLATGSIVDGAALDATGSYLIGTAKTGGGTLAGLSYTLDGGIANPISYDAGGNFTQALDLSKAAVGNHVVKLSATDLAGNVTTKTLNVSLASLVPLTITSLTPVDGAADIGVTYRPKITFSRAINAASLNSDDFYATNSAGNVVQSKVVLSDDHKYAYLFFTNPLPGSSTITLHVDGSKIRGDTDGTFLDAANNGTAGSTLTSSFVSVSTSTVANTILTGTILDPGTDLQPMTFDDVRAGPDQRLHTADDVYLLPIAHVKVFILGHEDQAVYTDAKGNFTLTNVPTGDVKVEVDGTTATNAPAGYFFPSMVMDTTIRPGITNTLMGSMGTDAEQADNATYPVAYLPRVQSNILQNVSATDVTTITAQQGASAATRVPITDEQRQQIQLTIQPGSILDANGNPLDNAQVGISTVPAALVKDMLPDGLMQHTFDITIQAPGASVFTTPATLTMPNVFGLAPGQKTYILSFDHTTGKLVIDGTATVSADGKTVTSDPGQGVTAPGWHGVTPAGIVAKLFDKIAPILTDCGPILGQLLLDTSSTALPILVLAAGGAASGPIALAGAVVAGVYGVGKLGIDIYQHWDEYKADTLEGLGKLNDLAEKIFTGTSKVLEKFGPESAPAFKASPLATTLLSKGNSFAIQTEIDSYIAKNASSLLSSAAKGLAEAGEKLSSVFGSFFGGMEIGKDLVNLYACATGSGAGMKENVDKLRSDLATVLNINGENTSINDLVTKMQSQLDSLESANDYLADAEGALIGTRLKDLSGTSDSLIWTGIGNLILAFDIDGKPYIDQNTGKQLQVSSSQIFDDSFFDNEDNKQLLSNYGSATQKYSDSLANFLSETVSDFQEISDNFSTVYNAVSQEVIAQSPGTDNLYYKITDSNGNLILSGKENTGVFSPFLPTNATLRVQLFDQTQMTYGEMSFVTPASGQQIDVSAVLGGANPILMTSLSSLNNIDADGLPDLVVQTLGLNPNISDNIVKGMTDLAALQANLVGNTALASTTGTISSTTLKGAALSIAIAGSAKDPTKLTAYIAEGSAGMAVVDVSKPATPQILSQTALPGNATDIAVDIDRGVAVVGGDAGLSLVDISDPVAPKFTQTVVFADSVTRVGLHDGIAYVAAGSSIYTVNVLTGDILQQVDLSGSGGSTLTDLTFDGDTLFAFDTNHTLRAFSLTGETLTARGKLDLPASGNADGSFPITYGAGRIAAGGGEVYVETENDFAGGYQTVNASDLDHLKLSADVQKAGIAGGAMALNGSGLGIAVGRLTGRPVLDVLNVSDPTNTGNFITRITMPGTPNDIAIANGIAFVADDAGLQVVNYLGFDTKGKAPAVSANVAALDRDSTKAGIQVVEGDVIHVTPTVTDDVQVRNVELFVNGQVVANDPSYPFSFSTLAPTIASGGKTMTVQLRATDTGGNATLTDPITIDIVKDTFPPVLQKSSVAENAKLFFVKSVDFTFDSTLDLTKLDPAKIKLVNIGADGKPGTADDTTVAFSVDTRANGQIVSVRPNSYLLPGVYKLTIDGSAIVDHSGNVATAPVTLDFTIRPASNIKAASGAPAITQAPSANPGQQISIPVPFDPSIAYATFHIVDANGTMSTRNVQVTSYDASKGIATFTVPLDAVTGDTQIYSQVGSTKTPYDDGTFLLQIVPVVTGIQSVSSNNDGTATIVLSGYGFVEANGSSYTVGSSVIADTSANSGPDVYQGYYPAYTPNGAVSLRVPLGAVSAGAISVTTGGGTSAAYTSGLSGITGVALSGTPADASKASANPGQTVTLTGTGLTTSTPVVLSYLDSGGTQRWVVLTPSVAKADGTSATLTVPGYANGAFGLQVFGSSAFPTLQIVPVVTAANSSSSTLQLSGGGFVEGASTYKIANASVIDSTANDGPDVTGGYAYNGNYYQNYYDNARANLTEPVHGTGTVTVTTAGGTSAAALLNVADPGLGYLGDVATDANAGTTWVVSGTNGQAALEQINLATGATIKTIALPNATFSNTYAQYSGLQVAPTALTLGSTAVAKGSLLLFNGYAYPNDQVIAINPATGAVIATLNLADNYDLSAGLFDPTSGHLFVVARNGGARIIEINPATGAQISTFAPPFSTDEAALAIDPVSGNLWFGSNYTSTIALLDRTGKVLRQVDLAAQGFKVGVNGLAFDATNKLIATTSNGEMAKLDLGYDPAMVKPVLASVAATATDGVALQTGTASANVGQTITLTGSNFGSGTQVVFQTRANDGTPGSVAVAPNAINADGTVMQVVVPSLATTGNIQVVNIGNKNLGYSSYTDAIYRKVTLTFTPTASSSVLRFADDGLEGVGNESWGIDNVSVSKGGTTVFQDNFEGGAKANWSNATTDNAAAGVFSQFSGRFSNGEQKLNLTGLTAGQTYTLTFDLYVLDSWDGQNGPDKFEVSADGNLLMRDAFANYSTNEVQTFNASAAKRLQIVPTLTAITNGRPGTSELSTYDLIGSGFMAGASTVTVGGVATPQTLTNQPNNYVSGNANSDYRVTTGLTLEGPVRITTDGGYAELSGPVFGAQPAVAFTGIQASATGGAAADPAQASANAGQAITLVGQGFTSNTLVQFSATDDTGASGVLTRTGQVGNNGTTLTVIVPALAKTGLVHVLGSTSAWNLQVVPLLRGVGGTIAAGNVIELDGTGLNPAELQIKIDGIGVGAFGVKTLFDNTDNGVSYSDQQILTVTVPTGVSAGAITVSTKGGSSAIKTGVTSAALTALAPASDVGDTITTAIALTIGLNQKQSVSASVGDGTQGTLDVDLYKVVLGVGDQLNLTLNGPNSHLRIFDATGKELSSQYIGYGDTSQHPWFAPAAGTYYVGVSGYYNLSYNPLTAGSGSNGAFTGNYQLTLERRAQGATSLTGITATATSGTPAKSGVPSANTGQTITLTGTGLTANDQVLFEYDNSGTLTQTAVAPASVASDGKSLTVVVPVAAATGTVRLAREQTGLFLQIVPTLGDISINTGSRYAGNTLILTGSGFAPAAESIQLGSLSFGVQNYYYSNTQASVTVPNGAPTGPISVTTAGGTSATFQRTFTGLTASATSGSATDTGKASANPGQTITLKGTNLTTTTAILFQTIDAGGTKSDVIVNPAIVAADGKSAQVVVPLEAISGTVRVVGDTTNSSIALQIVPVVTGIESVTNISSDGTATIVLSGYGFVEGNDSVYHFGAMSVTDPGINAGPDVYQDYGNGYISNGAVSLRVPLGAISAGAISVTTGGGTSAAYTAGLTGITGVALSGTPADGAKASANPGQAVTLTGTGLTTSTPVVLSYLDSQGVQIWTTLFPSAAKADGTSATLTIPGFANGAFGLQVFGSSALPVLQIVPVISSVNSSGNTLSLNGGGFVEGATTYKIANASVVDAQINDGPNVTGGYTGAYNGNYYQNYYDNAGANLTEPVHGTGTVTVTTAGGTSAAALLNVADPGLGYLGDVAIDTGAGTTWVVSGTNGQAALEQINLATGATIKTIALPNATFSNTYAQYSGLQVAPTALTLGGTAVAKGSLLLFNGYAYPKDQVIAINPATGAVIATLNLADNYDLSAGLFDPTSGHLFVVARNGGAHIVELNPATGAEISTFAIPFSADEAALAIDPVSGNLWFGSNYTSVIALLDRTGKVLRQVDLSKQGFGNGVNGLAFDATNTLIATTSNGEMAKLDLGYDPAIVKPVLASVTATATDGVALQAGTASANVGQTITLTGSNFGIGTEVVFQTRDALGNLGSAAVTPSLISADGTMLQVVVPGVAATGNIQVVNIGNKNLGYSSYADAIYRKVTLTFTPTASSSVLRFADDGLEGVGNESWGIDNVSVSKGGTTVFQDNFEGGAKANWSNATTDNAAAGVFSQFSGRFSNGEQKLNLTGLPAGLTYTLTFDLYVLDSWDGLNGSDKFEVSADGTVLMRDAFANYSTNEVQTFNASAGKRLQIVPTLTAITNGRPGTSETGTYDLIGSGFMAGASTITVGGVAIPELYGNQSNNQVSGNANSDYRVTTGLTLEGPVRITTDGGYAEVSGPVFGAQPPVLFGGIQASAAAGAAADGAQASANAGQAITLVGQGFTSNTLVQFSATDDAGVSGVLTRTGQVGNNGTTLTVIVPALAKTGLVHVLGSDSAYNLQVVPLLRGVGGTIAAGNVIELEGTGLNPAELQIKIDGIAVGAFGVKTLFDNTDNSIGSSYLDQQILTVTVPTGVGAGAVTISTKGGSAAIKTGVGASAVLTALNPASDVGDTIATATALAIGLNQKQTVSASVGDGTQGALDIDLYKVVLGAGDQLNLTLNSSNYSHLRIFDAAGTELSSQYFSYGDTSSHLWSAPAAGTYYLGVSGYYNFGYDPTKAGTGTGSGNGSYTGSYQLTLDRRAQGATSLTGITATAASGTPAKSGVASANTGQTITLTGTGLTANDQVVFEYSDGSLNQTTLQVASVTSDGKSLTVVVPANAVTGTVRLAREQAGLFLQVVPTLSDVATNGLSTYVGNTLTLTGTGFEYGAQSAHIGGATLSPQNGYYYYYGTTQMVVTVPNGAATGPISVTTAGGTSAVFQRTFTGLTAAATSGAAADTSKASANPGQTITLKGTNLTTTTSILFQTIDANGTKSEVIVNPATVAADGKSGTVVVPLNAITGTVRVVGDTTNSSVALQIVPVVTGVTSVSSNNDGTATVVLAGYGFVEGNDSVYHFGATSIADPGVSSGADVYQDYRNGYIVNGAVSLRVPFGAVSTGAISVTTSGGTSASYSVGLTGITSIAATGTPADASKASANPGQTVTLTGTGLTTATPVVVTYIGSDAVQHQVVLLPATAKADGTSATLAIGNWANGIFGLQVFGSSAMPVLQIVPVVTAIANSGGTTILSGAGFVEAASTYHIGNATVVDTTTNDGPDVYGYTDDNMRVNIAEPVHGTGSLTVTTAGGTSAAAVLNEANPGLGYLGDVATDTGAGTTWVISGTNGQAALEQINLATGATVKTIALPTATFGNTYAQYGGLQVAPAALTLGGTAVAKGSLLLFNGYAYPKDQVVAINPATGAVIATLTLADNYDLNAGLYDPASGHLFVVSRNLARIVELNPTTGAQIAAFAAPYGFDEAALAIDPVTGNLWFGSNYNNSVALLDKTGKLIKQVDLTAQGINNGVNGLAFDANNKLLVINNYGMIRRVDVS
ncbi:Ig-like domain-containing protein [Sphingomonas sp. MMS24-J13]|uniref:Ig-like domain-containing protein n=1 Tax=Sphingomonas sp. MMS24-J13 TaxID=3238686 RepID=UPI00384D8D34